ncbi:MAG: hypothetical protein M1300_02740 [Epsilonproteobacteria bacterium]|nr:hypothetical protein [Campylobacterota bacterium]
MQKRYLFHSFGYHKIDDHTVPAVTLTDAKNPHERLQIIFEAIVGGYRLTFDKKVIETRIAQSEHDASYLSGNFVFIIENSEYLAWLAKQCYHCWPSVKKTHYMILTDNALIDVYSWADPLLKKG